MSSSVADPDPGSGFQCLFDPWILDPGYGMSRSQHPDPGSGIGDKQPGSYFLELRNHFFFVKTLKFFDADPGSGIRNLGSTIRDGDSSDPGSGMEKSRIRDLGSGINILDSQHCYVWMFMVEADNILFCG
jgi:hypothetical protein